MTWFFIVYTTYLWIENREQLIEYDMVLYSIHNSSFIEIGEKLIEYDMVLNIVYITYPWMEIE